MISKKLKKILVALDGSKNSLRGLDMAIFLARSYDTKLTGIHIIPKKPKKEFKNLPYPEKPLLVHADKIMEYAKNRAAQNGILFEKKVSFGQPGQMIVAFAKSMSYDVILIGARGQSAIRDIFLGSVSNYVVHKSPVPVLIIK